MKRTVMQLKVPPAKPGETHAERGRRFAAAENHLRQAQHLHDRLAEWGEPGDRPVSINVNFNVSGPGNPARGLTVKAGNPAWDALANATRRAILAEWERHVDAIADLGFGIVTGEES